MSGNNSQENAEGPLSMDDAVATLLGGSDQEPDGTTDEPEGENVADDEQEFEATSSDEEEVSQEADADDEEVYEDADEDDDGEEELLFEIKGQQITLAEVEKSMMQHRDYTEKTQAIANERKQMAEMQSSIAAERQHLAQMLAMQQQQPSEEPDWVQMATDDPLEYTRQRAIFEANKAQSDVQNAERQRLQGIDQQEQQQNLQRFVQDQAAKMVDAIPELAGENAVQYKTNVSKYMQNIGFQRAELDQLFDHRIVVGFDKARKWDELMSSQSTAKKKVKGKTRVIKPGTTKGKAMKQADRRAKTADRLRQSGSSDDAVALLLGK